MLSIPVSVDLEGWQQRKCWSSYMPLIVSIEMEFGWKKTIALYERCVFSTITGKIDVFMFLTTKLALLFQNTEEQNRDLDQGPPLLTRVPNLLNLLTVWNVFLFQISLELSVKTDNATLKYLKFSKKVYFNSEKKNCFSKEPSIDAAETSRPRLSVIHTHLCSQSAFFCIFKCCLLIVKRLERVELNFPLFHFWFHQSRVSLI